MKINSHRINSNLKKLKELSNREIYDLNFPIAVFGTLRILPNGQGNHHRMTNHDYEFHSKGFSPHISPSGIWVDYKENCSGVVEVFSYDDENFNNAIGPIDSLEGFYYGKNYGYYRTLVNIHLLPENEYLLEFSKGIRWEDRDLQIPIKEWKDYNSIPCWIYTSIKLNNELEKNKEMLFNGSPIVWTDSLNKDY